MSTHQDVVRDERTTAVENASYRWAWTFTTYALLIDVMYRGIVRHEAAWDLLALVIVVGNCCTIYQMRRKVLPRGWFMKATLIGLGAALIGAVAAAILAMTKAM